MKTESLNASSKFKHTPAGEIPVDWGWAKLESVATIQTGLSKSSSRKGESIRMPYLRVANVQDGHFKLDEIKEIDVPIAQVDRFKVQKGDLLLTEGGDFDKLGRGAIWNGQVEPCVHQNHLFAVRSNPRKLDQTFLSSITQSSRGKAYFQSCSKQSTNLASINSTQLKQLPVPLPPLEEQKRIAEILTTWDTAIEKLDALIKAKERRKKALMQQLLTGNKHLPGFEDNWDKRKLDEVFEPIERKASGQTERVLSITAGTGFVNQRSKWTRNMAGKNLEKYILLRRGEFSYNKGNSKSYPQGCIYRLKEFYEGAVPNVWCSFRKRSELIDTDFFDHFFQAGGLNHQLSRLINAGVRNDGLLNLTAKNFYSVSVPIPSVEEQKEISSILDSINKELHLQIMRQKILIRQKRGLMQRLLTGKVRV